MCTYYAIIGLDRATWRELGWICHLPKGGVPSQFF